MVKKLIFFGIAIQIFVACADYQPGSLNLYGGSGVIYGDDSIVEISEESPLKSMTVALAQNDKLIRSEKVGAYSVEETYGIEDVMWKAQESLSYCSGVPLSATTVLTAGHCLRSESDCELISILPNFEKDREDAKTAIACKKVLLRKNDVEAGLDYAVLELEESIPHFVEVKNIKKVKEQDELIVVGHPLGSFKKSATGAVRKIRENGLIEASLDVFEGNSGSPVFKKETGELLGILSSGAKDFSELSGRIFVNRCPDEGCEGELIVPIQKILEDFKNNQ